MTRDAIFFTIGAVVGGAILFGADIGSTPERGKIVCHADGTTFTAHIDLQGIAIADLSNAVQMMCKFKHESTV